MLNRRYVRIKAFQSLYLYSQHENIELKALFSFYKNSIDKLWLSYLHTLALPAKIYQQLENSLDTEQNKHFILKEELSKYTKLLNNAVFKKMYNSEVLDKLFSSTHAGWDKDIDKVQHLYQEFLQQKFTLKYLEKENPTFEDDKRLLTDFIKYLFNTSELFNGLYEDSYFNWLDDRPVVLSNALKFFEKLSDHTDIIEVQKEKDWNEVISFGEELVRKYIQHSDELGTYIDKHCKNWESDRIALTDNIILKMGTLEFMHFEYIPVKVSMNEYIELAKQYSTPKSGKFVNGVLDSISKELKTEGKLVKKGRGLVEKQ